MQWNRASSRAEGDVSCFSRFAVGTRGILSSYDWGGDSRLLFIRRRQDSCLLARDTSRFFSRFGRAIGMPLKLRRETQDPFPVATVILGFLSIFNRSQASSPFEALNSSCLSYCQRDMRSPVEMRRGTRAFSRVCTRDSDIPSSWEMKDEAALNSLHGNPALFRVRVSRCPFHLRPQTQGPSHITVAERSLLLRFLRNVCIPLESKPGNQLSSLVDLGYMELFLIAVITSGAL